MPDRNRFALIEIIALVATTILAGPRVAGTQQPTPPASGPTILTATAVRAVRPPAIDGRGDDAVWEIAPRFSAFRQFQPRVDVEPSFRTEFQASYDEKHLYVFVRMFDPHPDSIMHALSRRDVRGPSDQIILIIDSYDDRRSGFEFAVNPDGVKRDYALSNDGNEDDSWNGIWDVATTVDSLGWTAEFRIPLSQLRYAQMETHTFGFGVWRDIERLAERVSWPLWSPNRPGIASQLGQLTGLSGITTARRLEVTPYAVSRNVQRPLPDSRFGRDQQMTAGGDLKFGITPNVTLDATVNPDFGQVDADPAVVNLTAFETFFAERRPFFVEGTGLYQFQLNCYVVVDCNTNEGLFYSRRIGRSPSLRDIFGDATTPEATPIAAATKLTGRTGRGLSFGLLDATTERVSGVQGQTVEPLTNYAVARAQQDLRGGEADVSVIATAVDRSLDALSAQYLHTSAYVTGASFRNRFDHGQYELAGQLTASRVAGSAQAIYLTQTDPVHYYQQPGDKPAVDSGSTSLTGHEEQLKFGKYGGGATRFETSIVRQSAGYDVNDIGFLRRADILDWSSWGALTLHDPHGFARWLQLNGNHWERWNTSGTLLESALNLNGHMGLNNNWDVHMGGTLSGLAPGYCDRCTRGGPLLRQSASISPWAGLNTDSRAVVQAGIWTNLRFADEGRTRGADFTPYVNVRISQGMQANIGSEVFAGHDASQWFGNFTDAGGATHYTFARLEQQTVSMSVRVNYTVTPALTFEFYGQPFVSTGAYSDFRELSANPGAASYAGRFQPYAAPADSLRSFQVTQLRTNSVVRWEYRPGSTLFFVWAHGRQDSSNQSTGQSWAQDYRDLFALHPENTFLIKAAYWLSR